jgi:cell division protein FtsB
LIILPKKKSRFKYKGSYLLAIAMLAVVAYFFVSFFNLKTQISEKEASIEEISVKCQLQQDENDELQRMLAEKDIMKYVEKRARDEDLGYVKPNERVYYDLAVSQ